MDRSMQRRFGWRFGWRYGAALWGGAVGRRSRWMECAGGRSPKRRPGRLHREKWGRDGGRRRDTATPSPAESVVRTTGSLHRGAQVINGWEKLQASGDPLAKTSPNSLHPRESLRRTRSPRSRPDRPPALKNNDAEGNVGGHRIFPTACRAYPVDILLHNDPFP